MKVPIPTLSPTLALVRTELGAWIAMGTSAVTILMVSPPLVPPTPADPALAKLTAILVAWSFGGIVGSLVGRIVEQQATLLRRGCVLLVAIVTAHDLPTGVPVSNLWFAFVTLVTFGGSALLVHGGILLAKPVWRRLCRFAASQAPRPGQPPSFGK